jgi:Flp pilus assembly pilin Flp
MMSGRSILARFGKNRDGVAAVEFAIVSIVLAGLVVAMGEGWQLATQQTAAKNAVSAGAMYYLQGGASDTAARDFALSAWPNRPNNADISIQRSCDCAGTSWTCSTLCSGGLISPRIQITLTAQMTYQDGIVMQPINATEVVRVR